MHGLIFQGESLHAMYAPGALRGNFDWHTYPKNRSPVCSPFSPPRENRKTNRPPSRLLPRTLRTSISSSQLAANRATL
jgi:hypothetical protein